MKAQTLAAALLADRNRATVERTDITACFMCARGMLYRGSRFCSDRCRDYYDEGNPGHLQDWRHPVITYRTRIPCAHCRKEFDSKGLRCCSSECERAYKDRKDNLAVMAEAGIEAKAKRQCEQCGAVIPQWRKVSIGVGSGPQIGIQKGPPRFAFRTISARAVGAGRDCGDGASAW